MKFMNLCNCHEKKIEGLDDKIDLKVCKKIALLCSIEELTIPNSDTTISL